MRADTVAAGHDPQIPGKRTPLISASLGRLDGGWRLGTLWRNGSEALDRLSRMGDCL